MNASPLLLYHSVAARVDARYAPWTVTPSDLAAQLGLAVERGFTPLDLGTFVEARASGTLPDRPMVVTFDDGLGDFLDGALPVLHRLGIPATLFVVAGEVGGRARWLASSGEGTRPMLGWTDLKHVCDAGIEIGSHGLSHTALDVLPAKTAEREIVESRERLQAGLGTRIDTFSYPHGYYDARTVDMVMRAGYVAACGVGHLLSRSGEDAFRLSRVVVYGGTSLERFEGWLNGVGLRRAPRPEIVRSGWRFVRRLRAG